MKKKKTILNKKTIISSFDDVQHHRITLLQWIKSLYKNGKIKEVKVISVNDGVALKIIFIDDTYITSETIPTLNQSQLDELVNAVRQLREDLNTEINDRELADSELQHDIDNHTTNTNIHVTQEDKNSWNNKLDSAIVSASVSGNTLVLRYEDGEEVTFTAGGTGGATWGNISGNIEEQEDLFIKLNEKASEDDLLSHENDNVRHITAEERSGWNDHVANADIHVTSTDKSNWNSKASQSDLDAEVTRATSEEGRLEGLIESITAKMYLHSIIAEETIDNIVYRFYVYAILSNNTRITDFQTFMTNIVNRFSNCFVMVFEIRSDPVKVYVARSTTGNGVTYINNNEYTTFAFTGNQTFTDYVREIN